jgi:hypothetical protein
MSRLKFTVFPTKNSAAAGDIVLIRDLRVIHGDPPLPAALLATRLQNLQIFGRSLMLPYEEVIFRRLEDARIETIYVNHPSLIGKKLIQRLIQVIAFVSCFR